MANRNNEDRMGIKDMNQDAPPTTSGNLGAPHSGGTPLTFIAPTEFVELPSKGLYYPQGHPLHGETAIEIKHMTTREEDILTSQALLRQGKALDRFVKSIIADPRINPDSLIIGDKNAVLVAARKSGYGAEYVTKVTCPACQAQVSHEFSLDEAHATDGVEELENEDNCEATGHGTFIISNLPTTGWNVEVRPLTGADEKKLTESVEARKKRKLPEDMLTTQLAMFTVSIQGVTDRRQIAEAVRAMPAKDSRVLRKTYQRIMPNLDLTQHFECPECSHTGEMEVPFTTDFFWPRR